MTADQIDDWESGRTQPSKPGLRKLVDHYIAWTTKYQIDGTSLVTQVLDLLTGGEDGPAEQKRQPEQDPHRRESGQEG